MVRLLWVTMTNWLFALAWLAASGGAESADS
jgi:hypothetical protein